MIRILALSALTLTAVSSPLTAAQTFTSGDSRAHLVELYTSQGCSSCPPADDYLGRLLEHEGLWRTWVPVAYHVDYWDYIGWKDRLATPDFSDRQRQVAKDNTGRVYTPAFFIDGEEWRGFFQGSKLPVKGRESTGVLQATTLDGSRAKITYTPKEPGKYNLVAHVALIGIGLDYEIKAGENRGRNTRHDFSALDYQSVMLMRVGDEYVGEVVLSPSNKLPKGTRALSTWVTTFGSFEPLQATGGFLQSTPAPDAS